MHYFKTFSDYANRIDDKVNQWIATENPIILSWQQTATYDTSDRSLDVTITLHCEPRPKAKVNTRKHG